MNEPLPKTPPGTHPAPEALYLARRGPRDASADEVLRHAALCARCAEEELRQEAFDAADPISPRRLEAEWARFGRPRATRRKALFDPTWMALAASLVLVASAGLFLMSRQAPDAVRGARGKAPAMSPAGTLDEAPMAFHLSRRPAAPVRVMVFDAERKFTWVSGPSTSDLFELPEAERKRLQPGVDYFWTVVGGDAEGPAVSFRLKPR